MIRLLLLLLAFLSTLVPTLSFVHHHHHYKTAAGRGEWQVPFASSSRNQISTPFPSSGAAASKGLRSLRASAVSKAITAIPSFFSNKVLAGMDDVYLKKSLYLPPLNTSAASTNAIIVFFPGIGLGPKHYNETALAIQKTVLETYGLHTYVVVAKFFNNLGYLPNEPDRRLTSIVEELSRRGVPERTPLGVIGHSGGAFLAYDTALTRSQAFVHLGSTLNSRGVLPWKPRSIVQYPKPLLTLLGEMDGYIRYTGGALEFAEVDALRAKKGFEGVILETPVIVLPGVSHEQFGDGIQSKLAKMSGRRDLPPYVPLKEAHEEIARMVAAFLALHCGTLEKAKADAASVVLQEAYDATGTIVKPYLNELSPQAEEDFIRWAQAEVASVEGVGKSSVRSVVYTSEPEFIYSKPNLDTAADCIQVCARRDEDAAIRIGFTKQISPAISLKMKRQEAVVQGLGRNPSKKSPTAMELNQRTFQKALDLLTEDQKERYERYGRKLEFVEDDEITYDRGGGPGWVATPIEVKPLPEDPMRVTVKSPVLYTPTDALPRFAGMCYMKLLTPAQAFEWLTHDAYITPTSV